MLSRWKARPSGAESDREDELTDRIMTDKNAFLDSIRDKLTPQFDGLRKHTTETAQRVEARVDEVKQSVDSAHRVTGEIKKDLSEFRERTELWTQSINESQAKILAAQAETWKMFSELRDVHAETNSRLLEVSQLLRQFVAERSV